MIESNRKKKSSFSNLHHISIAVRNIDEAIKFCTSFRSGVPMVGGRTKLFY